MTSASASPRHDPGTPEDLSALLRAWSGGDQEAYQELWRRIYDDLLVVARNHLAGERAAISTHSLLHESYLRLARIDRMDWSGRVHFFAVASRVMRRILVERARRRDAEKRGGGAVIITLYDGLRLEWSRRPEELIDLENALERLEAMDPRMIRVVECRFFGGMSVRETAAALAISSRSVERDWTRAKAYLYRELRPPGSEEP